MMRKLLGAAFVMAVCVSIGLAEEIRAVITKIDSSKVTFNEYKGKGEKGAERTLPLADSVKVNKGKFNQDTKKLDADGPLDSGLKNEALAKISADGVRATLFTEGDKVTEIRVGGGRKKQ
jgi:hypothetical protein